MSYETEDSEEVDIIEIWMGEQRVGLAGIARASGHVFLGGDLHPLGAFPALMLAAKQQVPYMSTSSVNCLFPSDWLRAECLADPERLRVIDNLEKFIRGSK